MEAMSNGVIGGRYSSRRWVISSSKPHEESPPFHLGYLVKLPRNEKKMSKSRDFLPLVAHSMTRSSSISVRVVDQVDSLDKFLNGIQFIKQHLKRVEELYTHFQKSYEESNNIHSSKDIQQLVTSQMRYDVTAGLDMSKSILLQLRSSLYHLTGS